MRIQIDDWVAFSRFLRLERGFGAKPQSFSVYARRFRQLAQWFQNKDFSRDSFIQFLEEGQQRGLKNSYLNNFVKMAKQIDRFFHAKEFEEFRLLREQETIPGDILTPTEIQAMAELKVAYHSQKDAINARQEALILLLGTTGCRIDEALSLTMKDIHITPAYVVFADTKNGDNRYVPISLELRDLMISLVRTGNYIFESRAGTKLTQQAAGRDIKQRARLCNIPIRVYPHLFRHSYCTEMLNQGVDSVVLAKITGHRDPKTLMTYYHQSLTEAMQTVMMHPLMKHGMSWEQETNLVKIFSQRFLNVPSCQIKIIENENQITLELRRNE